jgi:triosephosphate isomerase
MRKKILAANWKMNLLRDEAVQLINDFNKEVELSSKEIEVVVFSPSLYIHELSQQTNFKIGVQNFYFEKSGAFTGELSISQVKSCGANSLLIGHSERRQIFGESDELLKNKVNAAVESNMPFIFCCGEALETRDAEKHIEFVVNQLHASLFHLDENQILSCAIAYEPIWAIGTGETAQVSQIEEMVKFIRQVYENEVAQFAEEFFLSKNNPLDHWMVNPLGIFPPSDTDHINWYSSIDKDHKSYGYELDGDPHIGGQWVPWTHKENGIDWKMCDTVAKRILSTSASTLSNYKVGGNFYWGRLNMGVPREDLFKLSWSEIHQKYDIEDLKHNIKKEYYKRFNELCTSNNSL